MSWNLHPLFLREGDLLAWRRLSVFAGALADVHHWCSRLFVAHRIFGPVHLGRSGGEADCSSQLPQAMAGIGLLEQAGSYLSQKLDDERDYHPRSKINIEDFTIINKSLSLEANLPPSWEGRTC